MSVPKQKFTAEFKHEAVRLVRTTGKSCGLHQTFDSSLIWGAHSFAFDVARRRPTGKGCLPQILHLI